MALLSNLFGGDSESDNSFLGVLDLAGDFGLNTESYSYDNDDGEVDESYDSNNIGGDFDVGGILGSMSSSDSDSDDGSLLGIL